MNEFKITATSFFNDDNVVASYPCIKQYNYRVVGKDCFITFNSLDELIQFKKDVRYPIILKRGLYNTDMPGEINEIEIYDDWRE